MYCVQFSFFVKPLEEGWINVDEQVIRKRRQGKKEGRIFETEGVKRQI